jgi:hypothetical protein
MAQISTGGSVSGKANVDATFNLNVNTPVNEGTAGFVALSSEVDAGTVMPSRTNRALEVSEDYRLRVGVDTMWLNKAFASAILDPAFVQVATTMTYVQANGFGVLNSASAVANGNTINLSTKKNFPLFSTFSTVIETHLREANPTSTNSSSEWGLGLMTGVATPLDGVFWRRLAGGQLQGVVNFAGIENATNITTTAVPGRSGTGSYSATNVNKYVIVCHVGSVEFWINDILCLRTDTPTNQGAPTQSSSLPLQFRVVNSGVASAGRRIEVGFAGVQVADAITARSWPASINGNGGSSIQTQQGTAVAQTSNSLITALAAPTFTANTAPANAALGGKWITTSPMTVGTSGLATVADVHYPLFSYLNPAGTVAIPGKDLVIRGIRVGETVVSAVLGATYTQIEWLAGFGSSAATLATVDGVGPPTTVSPKRIHLGSQGFLALAPAGTTAPGFFIDFGDAPQVVPPGSYLHIIVSFLGNAATGTLRGSVTPIGYYE